MRCDCFGGGLAVLQAMDRINSSNKTRDTVGDIASIPWEDPEVDAQTKTQTFLQEVQASRQHQISYD